VIPFTKAHACGNDFLIINEEDVADYDKADLAQRLCERNTGVGADGIEFFERTGDFSGRIRLYNADGSIAEISGNGTRCVAAWMADEQGLQIGDELAIETDAGVRMCKVDGFRDSGDGPFTVMVTTDMDVPEFEERTIELADGTELDGVYVSMGNPHFVILLDNLERQDITLGAIAGSKKDVSEFQQGLLDFSIGEQPWQDVGSEICFHPDFPDQANVEFVRILGSKAELLDQVAIQIYERGVGPTSSSGTGTSATATAMIGVYGANSPLEVAAPGGVQTVEWAGPGERLYLTGPATLVARGEAW
jgi:diaminopimelate epimerase